LKNNKKRKRKSIKMTNMVRIWNEELKMEKEQENTEETRKY